MTRMKSVPKSSSGSVQSDAMDGCYDPKLHLFVDDHGIAEKQGVERVISRAKKCVEPVIRCDRPWESPWIYAWGSVLKNPETGRLQMWYETTGLGSEVAPIRTCYAESADGIHWDKPALRRYAFMGIENTNIVAMASAVYGNDPEGRGPRVWQASGARYLSDGPALHEYVWHYDGTNVVRDENEKDLAKRYKYIAAMWRRDSGSHCHNLMTSPDGIRWTMPPVKLLQVNDGTKVQWDPIRNKWTLTYLSSELLETHENVRRFEMAESDDLLDWQQVGKPFELDEGDGYGTIMQCHFLQPFAYGDQYVGIANMIHTKEGWAQGYIVSSRDGRNWERPLRRDVFVPLGGEGDFDADSAEAAMGAPIIVGDDMYIYYCGRARRHWAPRAATGAIGLLRLKRDRFAGLANGGWFTRNTNNNVSNDGQVITTPVEVTGPMLYLNARCREFPAGGSPPDLQSKSTLAAEDRNALLGSVRVELLDDARRPIPNYTLADSIPIWDDAVRIPVRWKNRTNVRELVSRQVSVRLVLNMSTIYAYIFNDLSRTCT